MNTGLYAEIEPPPIDQ